MKEDEREDDREKVMRECCAMTASRLDEALGTWPIDASVNLQDTHNWCISFAYTARDDIMSTEGWMEKFYNPAIMRLAQIVKQEAVGKKFTMFPMLIEHQCVSVIASSGNTHVRVYRGYDMETMQSTLNIDIHMVSLG